MNKWIKKENGLYKHISSGWFIYRFKPCGKWVLLSPSELIEVYFGEENEIKFLNDTMITLYSSKKELLHSFRHLFGY